MPDADLGYGEPHGALALREALARSNVDNRSSTAQPPGQCTRRGTWPA